MIRRLEAAAALLLAILWISPLIFAFWAAFHDVSDAVNFRLGAPLTLDNFRTAWAGAPWMRYFLNTFALVTLILVGQFVLCTLAGYAFAQTEFRGRDALFILVLMQLFILPEVLIVENYRVAASLGLLDSVVETLEFWKSLSTEHGIMPEGTVEWGTLRQAFLEGETAMMWHSTGNLTAVKNNATFDFGVAMLPGNARLGSPTGGGNFYLFKDSSEEEKQAALELIKFMTAPEQAAEWSIATGYMGVSPAAYETEALEAYTAEFPPALVARDQLEHAVAEFSTFETARVRDGLNAAIQSALTGDKSAQEALAEAQAAAERQLRAYR